VISQSRTYFNKQSRLGAKACSRSEKGLKNDEHYPKGLDGRCDEPMNGENPQKNVAILLVERLAKWSMEKTLQKGVSV